MGELHFSLIPLTAITLFDIKNEIVKKKTHIAKSMTFTTEKLA